MNIQDTATKNKLHFYLHYYSYLYIDHAQDTNNPLGETNNNTTTFMINTYNIIEHKNRRICLYCI